MQTSPINKTNIPRRGYKQMVSCALSPLPVYMWYSQGYSCLEPHSLLHWLFGHVCITELMWLLSDVVLKCNGSTPLCGYLPSLRCIFGNSIGPFQVIPCILFLVLFFINSFPNLGHKSIFCTVCYVAYFVCISEIFVNMENWMQLSNKMVFSASSFAAITNWQYP